MVLLSLSISASALALVVPADAQTTCILPKDLTLTSQFQEALALATVHPKLEFRISHSVERCHKPNFQYGGKWISLEANLLWYVLLYRQSRKAEKWAHLRDKSKSQNSESRVTGSLIFGTFI